MALTASKVVFRCVFCEAPVTKRTSWMEHRYFRRDIYCCENPMCNASFAGATELTHLVSPSGYEDGGTCTLPHSNQYLRNAALAALIRKESGTQGDMLAEAALPKAEDRPPAPEE